MAQNKKRKKSGKAPAAKKILRKPQQPEVTLVCDDIEKLSFANFLKCLINNNLSVLRISGSPSAHQLFMAWIKILSEYYTLIKDKQQLKYIKMMGKMEALNLKITVVKYLCEAIRLWYDEKMVNCLRNPPDKGGWGYKLSYSPETVLQDLEMTLTLLGNDEYKLLKMRTDYENEQKSKKKKGEAPSRNSFMKILYAIEKHRAPSRYRPDEITVYEFGMFYNEIVEYNEAMDEQNRKLESNNKYRNKNGPE